MFTSVTSSFLHVGDERSQPFQEIITKLSNFVTMIAVNVVEIITQSQTQEFSSKNEVFIAWRGMRLFQINHPFSQSGKENSDEIRWYVYYDESWIMLMSQGYYMYKCNTHIWHWAEGHVDPLEVAARFIVFTFDSLASTEICVILPAIPAEERTWEWKKVDLKRQQ